MRSRLALALAAGALLLVTGACDPKPSSPSPADLAAVDASPDVTITVDEAGFDPEVITVDPGQVIEIHNTGDDPHTATAGDRFDTGLILPGETTTLVLTTPGTIEVADTTTPDHTAKINVTPATTP